MSPITRKRGKAGGQESSKAENKSERKLKLRNIQLTPSSDEEKYEDQESQSSDVLGSESDEEFEVETILDKKVKNGVPYYRVKWKGFDMRYVTWEPVENLQNAPKKIEIFEKSLENKSSNECEDLSKEVREKKTSLLRKRGWGDLESKKKSQDSDQMDELEDKKDEVEVESEEKLPKPRSKAVKTKQGMQERGFEEELSSESEEEEYAEEKQKKSRRSLRKYRKRQEYFQKALERSRKEIPKKAQEVIELSSEDENSRNKTNYMGRRKFIEEKSIRLKPIRNKEESVLKATELKAPTKKEKNTTSIDPNQASISAEISMSRESSINDKIEANMKGNILNISTLNPAPRQDSSSFQSSRPRANSKDSLVSNDPVMKVLNPSYKGLMPLQTPELFPSYLTAPSLMNPLLANSMGFMSPASLAEAIALKNQITFQGSLQISNYMFPNAAFNSNRLRGVFPPTLGLAPTSNLFPPSISLMDSLALQNSLQGSALLNGSMNLPLTNYLSTPSLSGFSSLGNLKSPLSYTELLGKNNFNPLQVVSNPLAMLNTSPRNCSQAIEINPRTNKSNTRENNSHSHTHVLNKNENIKPDNHARKGSNNDQQLTLVEQNLDSRKSQRTSQENQTQKKKSEEENDKEAPNDSKEIGFLKPKFTPVEAITVNNLREANESATNLEQSYEKATEPSY